MHKGNRIQTLYKKMIPDGTSGESLRQVLHKSHQEHCSLTKRVLVPCIHKASHFRLVPRHINKWVRAKHVMNSKPGVTQPQRAEDEDAVVHCLDQT